MYSKGLLGAFINGLIRLYLNIIYVHESENIKYVYTPISPRSHFS